MLDVNGVGYLVAATPSVLRRASAGVGGDGRDVPPRPGGRAAALRLRRRRGARALRPPPHGERIGPKVALAVVSGSPAAELRRAIALGDHARFQAIPGIGKKTAERIVLELKEKLGAVTSSLSLAAVADAPGHLVARDALVELGYTVVDAERALAEIDPELPAEERVRLALRGAAA